MREKNEVKEFEETSIEGWTIYPPEDALRARRWMKTIEAVVLPAGLRGESKTEKEETRNAPDRERPGLPKGEKYS